MKSAFVLDSSIALAWCFEDEATEQTSQLLTRLTSETAAVPGLWYLEISNVLSMAERRKRISSVRVGEYIEMVESLSLEVDSQPSHLAFSILLPICRDHHLTCYDAVYLELANRLQLPLATLDEDLRTAAGKMGLSTLGK